jgi:hypothetical protein
MLLRVWITKLVGKFLSLSLGIKTKELLEANGFIAVAYMDYASELARLLHWSIAKRVTIFERNLRETHSKP